jgi:hypothetical protein
MAIQDILKFSSTFNLFPFFKIIAAIQSKKAMKRSGCVGAAIQILNPICVHFIKHQ